MKNKINTLLLIVLGGTGTILFIGLIGIIFIIIYQEIIDGNFSFESDKLLLQLYLYCFVIFVLYSPVLLMKGLKRIYQKT